MIDKSGYLPLFFQGTIIDIETTGLYPSTDKIITVGIISRNRYRMFQTTDSSNMLDKIKPELQKLPAPRFAFNKKFEEDFTGLDIDVELQHKEYEKLTEAIQVSGLPDPLNRDNSAVPSEWRSYLQDGKREHLEKIMHHNAADLLYELCLAIVRRQSPTMFATLRS